MNNRVFIVHGWSGRPDEHWLPWLKQQLEQRGFEVNVPLMSRDDEPVIEKWVDRLEAVVGNLDEHTYFVGHSIGCQTIMRYLEKHSDKKVGGCVFVAGWFILENLEDEETELVAEPWMKTPIDFSKILKTTQKFSVFISDNDDFGAVEENKQMFEQKLNAKVIVMHNMGHFTEGDGVTELPQVLDELLEYSHE
ncbi:MAG: serine hydrolase family protein [Candidatus Andersenbacteria bacterium]|nr:serine hydrolase family protein [Candidatus Andersenbacteria bacterium]MBI3250481.1 serine hydrolase family protein [Candidatus Andersenbacteria bacterium]